MQGGNTQIRSVRDGELQRHARHGKRDRQAKIIHGLPRFSRRETAPTRVQPVHEHQADVRQERYCPIKTQGQNTLRRPTPVVCRLSLRRVLSESPLNTTAGLTADIHIGTD